MKIQGTIRHFVAAGLVAFCAQVSAGPEPKMYMMMDGTMMMVADDGTAKLWDADKKEMMMPEGKVMQTKDGIMVIMYGGHIFKLQKMDAN